MTDTKFKQFQHVCIMPGGYLLEIGWNNKFSQYVFTNDITTEVMKYLYEPCLIHEDCLLIDVLLLIERNYFLLKEILDHNLLDILDEMKTNVPSKKEDEIEYLELYKTLDENMFYTNFHGIGFELQEDTDYYKKGERIQYAIDFASVNDLKNLPIKLNQSFKVITENIEPKEIINEKDNEYTLYNLGEVLYWIVYELTWHGSVEERNKKFEEIKGLVKKAEKEYEQKHD